MKLVYGDIQIATGIHVAGICSLYVVPKEWIAIDPVIDFDTGKVLTPVQLASGKFWIRMNLLEPTYLFTETPKDSKSGDYKEAALSGTLNYYSYDLQQILETLRRCELVALVTDLNQRRRLIGTSENGMIFRYSHMAKNSPGRRKRSNSYDDGERRSRAILQSRQYRRDYV